MLLLIRCLLSIPLCFFFVPCFVIQYCVSFLVLQLSSWEERACCFTLLSLPDKL